MGDRTVQYGVGRAELTLPPLKAQPSSEAVVAEHIDALNDCDWQRLMAQYPEAAEIHLLGGTVVKGRAAIGELFAGFLKDHADGGLKGGVFTAQANSTIDGTLATQWEMNAPYLSEPYKGSDAYITKDGLMQAMVSTFDGAALKMK